jgi:hypothetical protein
MSRGRVGEERGGKETDRCPLTVVEIDRDDAFCDQVLEDLIHHGLECCRTIGEAEVHHQGFK